MRNLMLLFVGNMGFAVGSTVFKLTTPEEGTFLYAFLGIASIICAAMACLGPFLFACDNFEFMERVRVWYCLNFRRSLGIYEFRNRWHWKYRESNYERWQRTFSTIVVMFSIVVINVVLVMYVIVFSLVSHALGQEF